MPTQTSITGQWRPMTLHSSFRLRVFILNSFYCYIFKFIIFSSAVSNLLLAPTSVFSPSCCSFHLSSPPWRRQEAGLQQGKVCPGEGLLRGSSQEGKGKRQRRKAGAVS